MPYKIYSEKLWHQDIGEYETYGLNYMDSTFISDISQDKKSLQNFADQLNHYKVDVEYIDDLITDYLIENV